MGTLKVEIKTLTPLWTGGVDGTMDRIHETGILGSLRWWYEAIVRGLGGSACDPTEHTCELSGERLKRYESARRAGKNWWEALDEAGICDACKVFGTTGWKRTFRLEGPVWWNDKWQNRLTVKVNNNRGWYLGHGYMGEDTLQIEPLHVPTGLTWDDVRQTLLLTLRLIECWGGLGAKTQIGYGVIDFSHLNDTNAIEAFQKLKQRSKRRTVSKNTQWPSLEGFFFAKVRFNLNDSVPEQWIRAQVSRINPDEELSWYLNEANDSKLKAVLPLAPLVRYYLRVLIKETKNNGRGVFTRKARHHLMGELGMKSLIHVSHAYPVADDQWEFRIWGWLPETLPGNVPRNDVLDHLRRWLGVQQQRQWHIPQNGALWTALDLSPTEVCWFEKDERESVEAYLKSLLEGCQGGENET